MSKNDQKKKIQNAPKTVTKPQQAKLSEDMQNQIKDAFDFYDTQKKGLINRNNLRSILGNFAFSKMNGKEIQIEIDRNKDNQKKQMFSLAQTKQMITDKWFAGKGREAEAQEMFALFDRKEKGLVGLNQIKNIFNQYLDIIISDADIMEFIEEADLDKDGFLSKQEFFTKLGYI